jgi:hypothetical protein
MRRPRHSTIAAYLALFVALGGTSYAAFSLPRNSVGSKQLRANSVASGKVKDGSLQPEDVNIQAFTALLSGPPGLQGVQGVPGVSGYELVTGQSANNSSDPKSVDVACPTGKKVVGGGARVTPAGTAEVKLDASYPTATGWTAHAFEEAALATSWQLTAYAVCALASP